MSNSQYQGLINEGSTCYLNSLIQTLFMTPQFRKNVYAYIHNSKKLENKNSIPFQLQKLFVLLQTSKSRAVSTKGLLKSFQWNEADAFEQHDVQQFCRKLFQAIEISNKKAHWITDLFEGSTISFVDCGKHCSQKQQTFLDISLPIHNPYTKVKFESLDECLKEYLKSEKLEDKFLCEQCGEKVQVDKGLKICKLPPLLTIQLNRFELNYETWQRQKLNNFLYFPEVLYMGKFMKKYEDIEVTQLPGDLKSKIKVTQKQKSARTANVYNQPTSFLTEVPKVKPKRKNSDEIESIKHKVFFYDEPNKRERQQKPLTQKQQTQKNKELITNMKFDLASLSSKVDNIVKKQEQKQIQTAVDASLDDDMLFGSGMGFIADSGPIQWNSGAMDPNEKIGGGARPNFGKTEIAFEHEEEVFDPTKEYPQNTYMLYAVLVHSGGAYGGHYYAFISNGKEWFRFDDSTVRKVSRFEMRKYGNFDKVTSGANAYLLFYRDVKTFKESNPDEIQIPAVLMEKINQDQEQIKKSGLLEEPSKAQKRYQQIMLGVMVKIINLHNIKPDEQSSQTLSAIEPQSLFIDDRHQEKISGLKEMISVMIPELSIIGPQNWRLRRYNKLESSLHEVYTKAYDNQTLEGLGFRETVWIALETKTAEEEFEDYDPKQIAVKINVWRPDITVVSEKALKPIKIQISEQASFTSLVEKIKKRFKIENPTIIKRNFSQSSPIQIFSNTQSKKLIELRFFNGINLYIEEPFTDNKSKWVEQFQSEKFRCLIKYNNPQQSDARDHELYFDTRKSLKQLKEHLSRLIDLPIEQFRIKKSRQSVSELITYNKKLYDLKFIANEFIYLEKGKSSCGVVILKEGRVEVIEGNIQFNLFEECIVELDENMQTIGDMVGKLAQQLNLSPKMIRIREYKAYQFGEIYRLTEPISRIKEKSLIWEKLKSEQLSEMKGIQLYIRVWDVINMQLGPLLQVYVDSGATYEQLAFIMQEELGIAPNRLLMWKALSNYVDKGILLDCDWIQASFIRRKIKEEPLFVMNDGQIFIVKEAQKEYYPRVNYTVGITTGGTKQKGKQAQLKITVMAENSDEEEEMMKQALTLSAMEQEKNENNTDFKQQAKQQELQQQESKK